MRLIFLLSLLSVPAGAFAAPVAVEVRGVDGKPLAGAVVQVVGARQPSPASRLTGPFVVAQKDVAFQPHLLIVPVGAEVSFPNRDKVRHHVYSFSPSKRFELKLYGRQEAPAVVFDKPGIVALGCNIHDAMSGFIVVADTPYAAQTDAAGRAAFADVAPGPVTVKVWHPSFRGATMITQPATVAPQGLTLTVTQRR